MKWVLPVILSMTFPLFRSFSPAKPATCAPRLCPMIWNFFRGTWNFRFNTSIRSATCTPTRRVFPAAASYRFKTLDPSPQSTTITFIDSFFSNSITISFTQAVWPLWVKPWMMNFTFRKGSNVELLIDELSVLRNSFFFRALVLVCRTNLVPMDSGWEGRAIKELWKGGLSEKQPYLP